MTEQLDTHDVSRGRTSVAQALASIQSKCLIIGMKTDVLYPLHEQEELADLIPSSSFKIIDSLDGHDGFLLEQDQLSSFISTFLASQKD